MYTDIELDLQTNPGIWTRPWQGVIANTVTADGQNLYVKIPGIDADFKWGPCPWVSRPGPTYPAAGQECLVVFDDNHIPWVTLWWPYA